MPTRSQRHLRRTQGLDSGGRAPVVYTPKAAATLAVAGLGTATATLTFGGGNAEGLLGGVLTITGLASGAAAVTAPAVAVTSGMTLAQLAARVAAALDGLQNVGETVTIEAAAAGAVVTLTEAGGGNIDAGLAGALTYVQPRPLYAPWPPKAAATAAVAGANTTTATITIAGGNAEGLLAGTLTVADLAIGAADVTVPVVPITSGMSPAQLAARLAARMDGLQDAGETVTIEASATGAVVTITEAGGGTIATGLAATVA